MEIKVHVTLDASPELLSAVERMLTRIIAAAASRGEITVTNGSAATNEKPATEKKTSKVTKSEPAAEAEKETEVSLQMLTARITSLVKEDPGNTAKIGAIMKETYGVSSVSKLDKAHYAELYNTLAA